MPVEMPKGLPFSVDTWTPSSQRKRHHFLTHAHRDHSMGIAAHASRPVYSTQLTKTLVLHQFPQLDDSVFVGIEVGQSLVIDDPDGSFTVTAFDANHCPGAVMFLFEGYFGNILHTGDCRLTPECVLNLPDKYIGGKGREPKCRIDFIFLDCTFGKYYQNMPSKHAAIRQVINCIWKHPGAPVVYLTCDLLGQEEILVEVSRTFGSKIYVNKAAYSERSCSVMLTFPGILTEDPSCRFHLFDAFPRLSERGKAKLEEARLNFQPEPLIVRPSSQWYACEEEYSQSELKLRQRFNEAVRDEFGVWHVCYSMHSSRDELEWALETLAPRRVVSTTPNCWAMELDYVKKNCFCAKIDSDDPLWDLLEISSDTCSISVDVSSDCIDPAHTDFPPLSVGQIHTYVECKQKSAKSSMDWREITGLSPPSKRSSLTLFGRARIGLEGSVYLHEEKEVTSQNDEPLHIVSRESEPEISCHKDTVSLVSCDAYKEKMVEKDGTELRNENSSLIVPRQREAETSCQKDAALIVSCDEYREKTVEEDGTEIWNVNLRVQKAGNCKQYQYSSQGPSKSFNESLRKLYRSKNVPVPRPLPSLVKLNASRRARKRF